MSITQAKKSAISFLAILCLLFAMPAVDRSAAAAHTFEVTVAKDVGIAIEGIKVYLYSTSGAYLGQQQVTSASGVVSFTIDDGDYKVRADLLGYQFWSSDTSVTQDTNMDLIISHEDVVIDVSGLSADATPVSNLKAYLFTSAGSYVNQYQVPDGNNLVTFNLPERDFKVRVDYYGQQYWFDQVNWTTLSLVLPVAQADVTVYWAGAALETAGVKVYVYSASGAYSGLYRTTDSGGNVTFLLLPSSYKFRADYQGLQYWTGQEALEGDQVQAVTISTGGGTFTLTVLKRDNVPLSGAKCYVYREDGSYHSMNSTTDTNGQVSFDLAGGIFQFRVDQLGYQFWSALYDVSTAHSGLFTVEHREIVITVEGAYQGSYPMAGIKVYLFTASGTYLSKNAVTDANGHVIFDLPDQAYKVRADYLGKQYWSEPFTWQDPTVTIPMADARITVLGGGFPQEGVRVYVFSPSGSYLSLNDTTDAAGQVTFRLPEETYKFRVDYQGSQYWSAEETLTAEIVNDISVSVGGGAFTLSVLKSGDAPLTGLPCYVYNDTGAYVGLSGATNPDGEVSFDLAEGTYKFRLDYLSYEFWSDLITVSGPATEEFLIPTEAVDVVVTTGTGPVAGTKVYVYSEGGAYVQLQGETDAQGKASFELPVAKGFTFRADILESQYWSDVAPIAAGGVNTVPIDAGGGLLEVTVQKAPAMPMEGTTVYLYHQSGTYVGLQAVTSASGQVTFSVPEGTYRVRADHLGYQFWSADTLVAEDTTLDFTIAHEDVVIDVSGLVASGPVDNLKAYLFTAAGSYVNQYQVPDGNNHVTFNLPERGFKVRVDYYGQQYWFDQVTWTTPFLVLPVAQADVTVYWSGLPLELEGVKVCVFLTGGAYTGLNGATDASGEVFFRLLPGTYTFRADYQGSQYFSPEEWLAPDQITEVMISTGGGAFSFTVLKGAGAPLSGAKCYLFNEAGTYLGMQGGTDSQGEVTFDLADGTYKFRVDYLGYQFWSDPFEVPTVFSQTLTIAHEDVVIDVSGLAQDGAPVANLKAYLFTAADAYVGRFKMPDGDGHVLFRLPERDFKVRVDYYGQQYWFVQVNWTTPSLVLPVAQADVAVNWAGAPLLVEGVKVYLFSPSGSYSGLYRTTDSGGNVTFLLLPGLYKFRADYQGLQYWSGEEDLQGGQTHAVTIATGGGTFLLTVTAGGSDPLFGAKCYVFREDGSYHGMNGTTDENGLVSFDLAGGVFQFRVDHLGYQFWSTLFDLSTTLSGTFAMAHQDVVISVKEGSSPVAGAKVYLYTATGAYVRHYKVTEADGQVVFFLPERAYKVRADYSGNQYWSDSFTWPSAPVVVGGGGPAQEPKVFVSNAGIGPAGAYTLLFGPTPPYAVTGTYEEIPGAVDVTAVLATETMTGSGANGAFSIQLPNAGEWEITVAEQGGDLSASALLILSVDDQPPVLDVDGPAQRTTQADVITIQGTATDAGFGVDLVSVVSDQYPGQEFSAPVDAIGAFSCEAPLRVGENLLTVQAEDGAGNETHEDLVITRELTALPTLAITSPEDGATVLEDVITVAGTVRSSLVPEQIRLVLGDQLQFPSGTDGEYTFSFDSVHLVPGPNTIIVTAQTVHGNVSAQTTVTYYVEVPEEEPTPPVIEIQSSTQPVVYLTEDGIVVSGTASSEQGISSITVNGELAAIVGSGQQVSFEHGFLFSETGTDEIEIIVVATDSEGNTSTVTYIVRLDATAPVIALTSPGLEAAPAVNAVTETPFPVTGTVTERYLAGLFMNGQSVGVLPTAVDDTYSFEARVALTRGEETPITIEAMDYAGNFTIYELILSLEADLEIEILAPREGQELVATEQDLDVAVTVRVEAMAQDDVVNAMIDDGAATALARSGTTANGTITMAGADGEHTLAVEVVSDGGEQLARRTIRFSVVNMADVPLALERQEPANHATGVEANRFIAFYFNRPISPDLLQVQVLETAHGLTYDTLPAGADITELSAVDLVEVHRDLEPVPGGTSHLPENTMAAFYPTRDFAYGGTVYITITYDGQELARTTFSVRPLPTFIEGFVADQFMSPVAGIEVTLPKLGRKVATDSNGCYGFGFGDAADEAIPAGRYRAVINPGLSNRTYGAIERWVHVEAGRLNSVGLTRLPILNPDEPFRRIVSGEAQALVAGGELTLDLTDADLTFPDGRSRGAVHVQFMKSDQFSYFFLASAIPRWVFSVQPMGIKVAGTVAVTISMPTLLGSHEYVEALGERVLLVGLSPEALKMVPVGVGRVNTDTMEVTSELPVALERLDIIGYAEVVPEKQSVLERFVQGEITLNQLIGELERE